MPHFSIGDTVKFYTRTIKADLTGVIIRLGVFSHDMDNQVFLGTIVPENATHALIDCSAAMDGNWWQEWAAIEDLERVE